jgi:hypothetical protein
VARALRFGGDRCHREGALIGAAIAGVVFLAPLALGFLGQDYFYPRNEIPAMIPLITVLAAACAVRRARLLGSVLALALLVIFSVAAIRAQTDGLYQRPNWRKVALSLGPATVARAILAADGTAADPLKIYLAGVDWTQSRALRVPIGEIDVVGALNRLPLAPSRSRPTLVARLGVPLPAERGPPLPRTVAPPGARLIARFRVAVWIVARFALLHPGRLSIDQLAVRAPEYFRHTPAKLLVFTQPAGASGQRADGSRGGLALPSPDGGWAVRRLARADPHVRAFRLSRNFGQDAAITAGLAQARGALGGRDGLRPRGGAGGHPTPVGRGGRGLRRCSHDPARLASLGVPALH